MIKKHSKPKNWALYGKGLIGSEILNQLSRPKVSARLGLLQKPEFIVRSGGVYSAEGNKIDFPAVLPEVGFFALPSSGDGSIAKAYMMPILQAGGTVVTAEKAALSNHFEELQAASDNFRRFGVNASVGGGTRIMEIAANYLKDMDNVTQVHMVLNGTLTSILSSIGPLSGTGMPLGQAVDQAIQLGYAEPGAETPGDVIAMEAQGDIPKKTSIFVNVLGLSKNTLKWQDLHFSISKSELKDIEEESKVRRLIVSLYNTDISNAAPESNIIGGFSEKIENWRIVAGFRDTSKNPLFSSLAQLTGAGNGIVIGLGPDESDGVISLQGQGAGPKPTVNTMLDDFLALSQKH